MSSQSGAGVAASAEMRPAPMDEAEWMNHI